MEAKKVDLGKQTSVFTRSDIDALLDKKGEEALDLSGQNLRGIDLSNLDLDNINFSKSDLTGANLSGAFLKGSDLRETILVNTNLDNADLMNVKLTHANLSGSSLKKASLYVGEGEGVNLSGADLTDSRATMADFHKSNMSHAKMVKVLWGSADLSDCILKNADLTDANLASAKLRQVDLTGAILTNTNLKGADLRGATLTEGALDDAITESTIARRINFVSTTSGTTSPKKSGSLNNAQIATPPAILGSLGTPGLTKKEVVETLQIDKIANANPANIQEVAASQIPIVNKYYESVLKQSQRSFIAALILSVIGTFLIFAAIFFLLIQQPSNLSYITLIGGAILNGIAGLNFYLYGKASTLLTTFQNPLDRIGRFLLANSVCENIEGDLKDSTRAKLVEIIANASIMTNSKIKNTPETTKSSKETE